MVVPRNVLVSLLALLAGAAVLLLLLRSESEEGTGAPAPSGQEAPHTDGPVLRGSGEETAAGEAPRNDAVPPPERWLAAKVVSATDGRPIAGARITVRPHPWSGDRRWVIGRTDATGQARLGPLLTGRLRVGVTADGFVEVTEVVPEAELGRLQRTFTLEVGHSISGRCVFPDGTPAPDMWIWAHGPGKRQLASSDAGGAFLLDDLAPGEWTLSIEAAINSSTASTPTRAATARTGTSDLVLTVDDGLARPVRITVTDPEGRPVPRFDAVGDERFARNKEHRRGEARLPTGHSVKWVEIRNPRTAEGTPLPLAPAIVGPLDNGRREVAVRLEPGRSIRGRVVEASGKGVPGVEIAAWPEAERPVATGDGWHASTTTDNEGAFELVGLGAGTYNLIVERKPPYADTPDVTCEAGAEGIRVQLRPAAKARLRVVDPDGQPVHDADLQVRRVDGGWIANPHSDPQGYVALEGIDREGEYQLQIDPPDDRPDLGSLEVATWSAAVESVALPRALSITGRVADAQGAPLVGAAVAAIRVGAEPWDYESAKLSDDGTFVVGHLEPGTYRVRAFYRAWEADSLVATEYVEAGTSGVELKLGRGIDLVLDLKGAPASLAGSEVILYGPTYERERRRATVTAAGTARFTVDPDMTYTFYRWLSKDDVVAMREGIDGGAGRVRVEFQPAQSLRVRVNRPAGSTRPEAVLQMGPMTRRPEQIAPDTFQVGGLVPGSYKLTVWCRTRNGEVRSDSTAVAGETVDVVLR